MNIVIAVLIFSVIVFVHELGHFLAAKKNGILVEEFAIGMGPKLVSTKKGDTVYSIRILPIGGFCKMLGEDESSDDERAFSNKSVWARIVVIVAGAGFNILLAFIASIIALSMTGTVSTEINELLDVSPAREAGLLPGDKIVKVDDHRISVFKEIGFYLAQGKGEEVTITFKRDGKTHQTVVKPYFNEERKSYMIGIAPTPVSKTNVFSVLKYSFYEIVFWIKMVYMSLGMLIMGNVTAQDVAGPIGIVNAISKGYEESVQYGISSVINTILFYIILLSSNLGVINLLPVPALDGGRLVFLLIEAVRGKPMNPEREGFVHFIGFVLLMVLMVFLVFNDFRNWIL